MKIATLLLFCFIFSFSSYAQNNEMQSCKGRIGMTFSSFGKNDVIRFQSLVGEASYNSDKFYTLGISYLHQLNNTFDFETGLEFSKHKIIIKPNAPPDADGTPYGSEFSLISIPVALRINFLKYCFVNSGLNLDIDPTVSSPVDSQNGIGALLGFGLKYDTHFGLSAFVNPYIKAHSLISFSAGENHQRLMETGFRFGVMYKLK